MVLRELGFPNGAPFTPPPELTSAGVDDARGFWSTTKPTRKRDSELRKLTIETMLLELQKRVLGRGVLTEHRFMRSKPRYAASTHPVRSAGPCSVHLHGMLSSLARVSRVPRARYRQRRKGQ